MEGAKLEIGEWYTTMLSLLEPSSNSIDSTGIEKQLWQVSRSSEVHSVWENTLHTISDNYILELTLYIMIGEVY